MKLPAAFYTAYWITVLADILLLNLLPEGRLFTKPLLMPLLMLGLFTETKNGPSGFSAIFLSGLLFSWLGDLFLMGADAQPSFFLTGLAAFLIAHILYIRYFIGIRTAGTAFLKSRPVMLVAVLVFVIELLHILWPGLGQLKIPVIIYAVTIGTMLAFALWQFGRVENWTAGLFISGALLFVFSDALLAVNMFRTPFTQAGSWVMITYCCAQYLLTRGCARERQLSASPSVGTLL